MAEPACVIKCEHCKRQFASWIQYETAEAFYSSPLVGEYVLCTACGQQTLCTRDNMLFDGSKDATAE